MDRLDRILGRIALPLVLVTIAAVPLAALAYDRYVAGRTPEGAKVFWISFDGQKNWTDTRISAWSSLSDHDDLTEIRVRRGDLVVLRLMATDVYHGFALPEFRLGPIELVPGEMQELTFLADKTGRFPLFCTVVCGPAHTRMMAWLVVSP